MTRLLVTLFLLVALVLPAAAEEKALRGVALVIGQSKYEHLPPLANPDHDAKAIEAMLEGLGFEVTGATDRNARKLRRDFERFVEDAEGADAAIIYYSGHGIEAGGENFLVPVDADLQALNDVDENLVPLSGVLDELRTKVQLTIFLIDACRTSPFPPGSVARKQGQPVAMSGSGLGTPRGFAAVAEAATDTVGTVIGFAAEPGRPALDGEPNGNSPYAAALLRHLSAMTGTEFGLVMRMVTEEVYLKTGTQQRPWVNESLRKQLFFGTPETLPEGAAGAIIGERRKLLLTISDLGEAQRRQVEKIAAADKVPLDTLYGILGALGEKGIPKDPAAVAIALRGQAERLRQILDERRLLSVDDPEITRLLQDADKALAEGAMKSARGFLDEAKKEVALSRHGVEKAEAQASAKRRANAEVHLKSAEAAEIDFDFEAAAADYAAAADWVKESDPALKARYKTLEADSWQMLGFYKGDSTAMFRGIAIYDKVLRTISRADNREQWIKTTHNLANAYLRLGNRNTGTTELERAAALYREVIAAARPEDEAKNRATTMSNLGIALNSLAERTNDAAMYAEAGLMFEASLVLRDKASDPASWAIDTLNAANLELSLAARNGETDRYGKAGAMITDALSHLDADTHPVEWAQARNNLGIAMRKQGINEGNPEKVKQAIVIYGDVLPRFDRKLFPVDWGDTQGNMAIAHATLGAMTGDISEFETAVRLFEGALEEVTRARSPVFWATLQNTYGMMQQVLGVMKSDPVRLDRAIGAFRNALAVRRKKINAPDWAESQQYLASALSSLASAKGDQRLAGEAIAAYRAAREVFTREAFPSDWRSVSSGLAMALQGKGIMRQDVGVLGEAEAIYREVMDATWDTAHQ